MKSAINPFIMRTFKTRPFSPLPPQPIDILTFQLEKLEVKKDEIRGAMEELGERPFCRTLEHEKQDVEEEKKRKLEEEEEERERKRMKVIPTVKGVEVEDYFQD